ncbi:hypothetical protein BDQ17DRAFT_1422116 [Cyathus striatus]|nr:hypothetical protein BDQ17DRAFT_1422116 [Cyathus striatus]
MSSQNQDMSWKYLQQAAGSRLSSFKGYLREQRPGLSPSGDQQRQSWRAWAGEKITQKLRRRESQENVFNQNREVVSLFPGWAARKYSKDSAYAAHGNSPRPFEVEVFISGYTISHRRPEHASRSQRAFIRLAKGFASLPKLTADHLHPTTTDLPVGMNLPPRPTEIDDDYNVQLLERQLQKANISEPDSPATSLPSSPSTSTYDLLSSVNTEGSRTPPLNRTGNLLESSPTPSEALRKLHANLESRLLPFWSSVLPNRQIHLRLFASPHRRSSNSEIPPLSSYEDHYEKGKDDDASPSLLKEPLATLTVTTAVDGSFQAKFRVKWDELCQHPKALHIAFGEEIEEHDISSPSASSAPFLPSSTSSIKPTTIASLRIPITHSPIRVISDIDDTIKRSDVLSGARAVFHAVFVKELKDAVVPGMGEWYSNGPFEYLPVLNEFFKIARLPPGSLKLKSYAGRSLFNGLLSAPAARKRTGVVDVLDAFPDSQFILVGDSGEQDLELYADLARERPTQILAVFVRDVSTDNNEPLEDPTGWKVVGAAGSRSGTKPLLPRSESMSDAGGINGRTRRAWSAASLKFSLSSPSPSSSLSFSANITEQDNNKPAPLNIASANDAKESAYFTSARLSEEPEDWPGTTLVPKSAQNQLPKVSYFAYTPRSQKRSRAASGSSFNDFPLKSAPGQATPMRLSHHPHSSATSHSSSVSQYVSCPPGPTPPLTLYPSSTPRNVSQTHSLDSASVSSLGSASGRVTLLTEPEKKRYELQTRVYRARTQMPGHVMLRLFRDPRECQADVEEVLGRESKSSYS